MRSTQSTAKSVHHPLPSSPPRAEGLNGATAEPASARQWGIAEAIGENPGEDEQNDEDVGREHEYTLHEISVGLLVFGEVLGGRYVFVFDHGGSPCSPGNGVTGTRFQAGGRSYFTAPPVMPLMKRSRNRL